MPFADIILRDNGTTPFDVSLANATSIEPAGIASEEAFGTHQIANDVFITDVTGISSEEAFGTPQIANDVFITISAGIDSAEIVSSGLSVAGNQNIIVLASPSSQMAFGTPQMVYDVTLTATSITSEESFGTPTVVESTEAYLAAQRTANRRPKFPGYLQQGIYMRRFDRKIVLPVLGPEIDSYYLTGTWFGQPKNYSDNTAFHDISRFEPVGYLSDVNSTSYFPAILGNVNLVDPLQMDGIIEPLTIRSAIAGTSIDSPYEAKGMWGSLEEGNTDFTRKVDRVFQHYETVIPSIVSPFLDSGDYLGTHLSGSIKMPGEVSNNRKVVRPFSDVDRAAFYDISTTVASSDIVTVVTALTTSQGDFLPRNARSSGAGFTYVNNPVGTDSLAFGGLKR